LGITGLYKYHAMPKQSDVDPIGAAQVPLRHDRCDGQPENARSGRIDGPASLD